MRDAMVRGLARWGVLSLAGSAVVAVPDSGPPIVPFSRTHGPSLVDAVGVVLLLVGWAAFLLPLWRYRRAISHRGLLVAAVTIGAALLGWSVATDTGMWWVGGAIVLVAAQVAAGISVIRRAPARDGALSARGGTPTPTSGDGP